jgi:hypothetical protein
MGISSLVRLGGTGGPEFSSLAQVLLPVNPPRTISGPNADHLIKRAIGAGCNAESTIAIPSVWPEVMC